MIRVFPRRTKWTPIDELAFVGDPPIFRPPEQPVMVSVVFTWDIEEGQRLFKAWSKYYRNVHISGPAFNEPGGHFYPEMFIKKGVTFTSRGCPKKCSFCLVSKREGNIRELPIIPGNIIQDNNLLACSRSHQEKVFEMLQTQKGIKFSGGLDGDFLKEWHVDEFKKLKIAELWFACDAYKDLQRLERVADLLSDFSQNKKRCYVLIGFNQIEEIKRLRKVFELGFLPFAQLYQGIEPKNYDYYWKSLARTWSRPCAYKSLMRGSQ
jgi:hypothetical protein